MAEKESKNKWHTPAERIMMLGFAAVILPVSYTHLTLPTTPYV